MNCDGCRRDWLKFVVGGVVGAAGFGLVQHLMPKPKQKMCKLAGTPLDELHNYLCAFHVSEAGLSGKGPTLPAWPTLQVEAHHYCMPVGEGMYQCIILESNKPGARILGVEYIITEELYKKHIHGEEHTRWHKHDYEVDSGLLVCPNMTREEEDKFLSVVKTTYGKTIHTWANPTQTLPLGDPIFMYAFTKDGQIDPELIKKRDADLGINTEEIRKHRSRK